MGWWVGITQMGGRVALLDFNSCSSHKMAADSITIYCQNHDHLKPFLSADEWNIILWKTYKCNHPGYFECYLWYQIMWKIMNISSIYYHEKLFVLFWIIIQWSNIMNSSIFYINFITNFDLVNQEPQWQWSNCLLFTLYE